MSASFHIAQCNIGRFLAPTDNPKMADFMNNLDPVNAVAEAAPGFVWRLTDEDSNDATAIRPWEDDELMAINMSVWESIDELAAYVMGEAHKPFLLRRREWFEVSRDVFQALWWVPAGHQPTVDEAVERIEYLRANGPTEKAFSFKDRFPPPA